MKVHILSVIQAPKKRKMKVKKESVGVTPCLVR